MASPSEMQFTTAPGKNCGGCLFENERSTVCHEVARVAVRAGLPDCEYSRLIYVARAVDERQLELVEWN